MELVQTVLFRLVIVSRRSRVEGVMFGVSAQRLVFAVGRAIAINPSDSGQLIIIRSLRDIGYACRSSAMRLVVNMFIVCKHIRLLMLTVRAMSGCPRLWLSPLLHFHDLRIKSRLRQTGSTASLGASADVDRAVAQKQKRAKFRWHRASRSTCPQESLAARNGRGDRL